MEARSDAINSDRKVWTTAALSAVGGAVGGYFLGRALDKRQKKTNVTWRPAELERTLMSPQWSALRAKESPGSWPGARLVDFPDGLLGGRRVGINLTNLHLAPYWDLSYLYLVSQLRRFERAPDPAP